MQAIRIPEEIGQREPLGADCHYCGSPETSIELRIEAKQPGEYSLAGVWMKFSARTCPYAVCGHVSRGEFG